VTVSIPRSLPAEYFSASKWMSSRDPAHPERRVRQPARAVDHTGARQRAGRVPVYARGIAYHADGRVEMGAQSDTGVAAIVRGTVPYRVALRANRGRLEWSCSCPVGEQGDFCKHCVAVTCAVAPVAPAPARRAPKPRTRAPGARVDTRTWRRRLDRAFAPGGGFVSYQDGPDWAANVHEVLHSLGDLVDADHARTVVPLADLELTSELDAFHHAAVTYAEVLGADGLAEYRRIVEPKWRALRPGGDPWSARRSRIREAMVGVAIAGGDPDDLIGIKQRDLRVPNDYLEIAESVRADGRTDDAIEWARRGLDAFAQHEWLTRSLRELYAEMLRERGDVGGAVDEFRRAFERHPSRDAYRRLLAEAELPGRRAEMQASALDALRARIVAQQPDGGARSPISVGDSMVLIEILLFEGDVDGVWETAQDHGCGAGLWLTLARARETTHPLDAILVYEKEVLAKIETRSNDGYRRAVDLLARIRTLVTQAGHPERFDELLAEVRTVHKPKRNLMALIDKKGW
jgi:uncharacterized Zn finger protein